MSDRPLVETLRSRDPGAIGAVYDRYAERIYGYCWFQMRGRDAAQVALRDTFIVAEAHIDKLRDPGRLAPWLYALARIECARRPPHPGQKPDIPIAGRDQADVDERVMAWRAVMALTPLSRELLELRERHRLAGAGLAAVVGLPVRDLAEAIDQARTELDAALSAELLARTGTREGDRVPAAKIYGMLPTALPPEVLRPRVMSCFTEPELVGYRLLVATRPGVFAPDGFPRQPRRPPVRSGSGRAGHEAEVPMRTTVAALVVAVAVIAALGWLATWHPRGTGTVAADDRPSATAWPGVVTPPPARRRSPQGAGSVTHSPVSLISPLGGKHPPAPSIVLVSSPVHVPQVGAGASEMPGEGDPGEREALMVSPLFLDLGTGDSGTVRLRAEGGELDWRATTSGPVRLSVSGGRLGDGAAVTLRLQVSRRPESYGSATVTFQPGGTSVTVTWREQAPSPGPSATPDTRPSSRQPASDPPTAKAPNPASSGG